MEKKQTAMPRHFDAIILDLNMPIMDGYEACNQILQLYKQYNERQMSKKKRSNSIQLSSHFSNNMQEVDLEQKRL